MVVNYVSISSRLYNVRFLISLFCDAHQKGRALSCYLKWYFVTKVFLVYCALLHDNLKVIFFEFN